MPTPAAELAALRKPWGDEDEAYTKARQALLAEEIELQRQIERVSEQRRQLPDGPVIAKDYRFKDLNGAEHGLTDLSATVTRW
ncbi:MAG: DUF899 family protein [Sphingomicrobium sp.]